MLKIDFHKYSVKDFLLDESFQRWARQEDPDTVTHFDNWLEEHPENGAILEEARTIVLRLKSHLEDDESPNEIEEVWSKIQNTMNNTLRASLKTSIILLQQEKGRDEASKKKVFRDALK